MRKLVLAAGAALTSLGMVVASAIGAEAAGFQTFDFRADNGNYTATARVVIYRLDSNTFRIRNTGEGYGWNWNTTDGGSGKFHMNAICLDWEDTPGHYSQYLCQWAPPSTVDDVPLNGPQSINNAFFVDFNTAGDPQLRFRFYGVGAGSIENRIDDYVPIGSAP